MTDPQKNGRSPSRLRWPGYALAVGSTAATLAVRLAMDRKLGGQPTLVIFTVPIMLSAYVGGLGPGLFSTALAYLAASYFLLPPIYSFSVASAVERWQQAFVALAGIVISALNEALHLARRRAEIATLEQTRAREELKAAVKETGESEARYRILFEYAPTAIVIADSESYYIDANASACRMLGYTREELIGLHASDIVARTEISHIQPALNVINAKSDHHREWQFRRKDGSAVQADVIATLMPDGNLLGMIRDITEQKSSAATAAQLAAIVDSSDDAIIGKDLQGIVTSWNPGAEKIFGYRAEEMAGQSIVRLIPPDRQQEEREILDRIRRGERVRHFETTRLRKDGRRIEVSVTVSALRDAAGNIVGASKVAREITERKLTEEAMRARDAAEGASRLKSEFLANMSHELRTPLNGIIGFSEFLADEKPGKLNPKQKEYLGDILASGRHLLQLINDVLDLAKIEAGKMSIHPERFALSKAVREACAVVSPLAKKKAIDLKMEISLAIDDVALDQSKFKQVLYNLLSNAVKFTGAGGRVEVAARPGEPGWLRLEVRDNGLGIKAEDLGKLFVEFQQLDSSHGRAHQGTGLGLALTKRIVELHGGRIHADSEPGRGSTFTVELPITCAPSFEPAAKREIQP